MFVPLVLMGDAPDFLDDGVEPAAESASFGLQERDLPWCAAPHAADGPVTLGVDLVVPGRPFERVGEEGIEALHGPQVIALAVLPVHCGAAVGEVLL